MDSFDFPFLAVAKMRMCYFSSQKEKLGYFKRHLIRVGHLLFQRVSSACDTSLVASEMCHLDHVVELVDSPLWTSVVSVVK